MEKKDLEFLQRFDTDKHFGMLERTGNMRTLQQADFLRMIDIYESETGRKASISCRSCTTPKNQFVKNHVVPMYRAEIERLSIKEADQKEENQPEKKKRGRQSKN